MKKLWIRIFHKMIVMVRQGITYIDDQYIKLSCECKENVRFMDTARLINPQKREAISIGSNVTIRGELHTYGHGGKIKIGSNCYVGPNTYIWSGEEISIGDRVMISCNCNIFDNDTHPLEPEARKKQYTQIMGGGGHPESINLNDKKISVGDDVLICSNVTILKGVSIGAGSVIGTNSLVSEDIPEYALAYGNPAKVVRKIKRE